jgi:hypothetical protein
MTSVKFLDVSNNSINDFNGLMNMTNLEEVYLYGNNTSDALNGSNGILNYQTYYDLLRNGVGVYNLVSEGVAQLFADSDEPNDYIRLKSIILQDKLSDDVSIETLYAPFSGLNYSAFGLDNQYGTITWGYESGKTVYTATYITLTYTFSGNNTLVVKFYVERY